MPRPSVTLLLLAVILCLGGVLRFHNLAAESLHFDEAWNLELSTGRGSVQERVETDVVLPQLPRVTSLVGAPPATAIWTHMDHVTHPPLYSMVLRLWRDAFGDGDFAARALSCVLSILCVLVLFDVVRLLSGPAPALWSAAIMAVAGSQIELAQDVRPYMLCLLMALCAGDGLLRIEKSGGSRLRMGLLTLSLLGMVLTHYFAVGVATALGGFAVRRCRKALIPMAVAALLFLILWGPQLWQQRGNFSATGDNWLKESPEGHLMKTAGRLAGLPLRLLFSPTQRTTWISYGAILVLILPFLMLRWRKDLLFWCWWIAGSVGLLLALDLSRGTWHLGLVRYTLLASPAVFALLASLTCRLPSLFLRHAIPVVALIGCVAGIPTFYYHGKPDTRSIAQYLDEHIKPGEVVVFTSVGAEPYFNKVLFLGVSHYSSSYPWPVVLMTKKPEGSLLRDLRSAPGVWVISAPSDKAAAPIFDGETGSHAMQFGFTAFIRRISPTNPHE